MDGHVKISKYKINFFFKNKNIPARVFSEIGRGSFGVVFKGILKELPVVIKVALSKVDARHDLEEETGFYKSIGQYHHLNTNILPKPEDGTGIVYYYGSENVHRHENLDWSKKDFNKGNDMRPKRSCKCLEFQQFIQQYNDTKNNNCIDSSSNNKQKNDGVVRMTDLSIPQHLLVGLCDLDECKICNCHKLKLHIMILTQFGESIRGLSKYVSKTNRCFDVQTTSKLMATLLVKLHWLHSRGLVHRDMKPNNMVIPSNMTLPQYANVFLIDLGLSKPWRTAEGSHIPFLKKDHYTGTIYYIGTHAHRGHQASRRDDLQALAIIGLSLMTGKLPWDKHDCEFEAKCGSLSSSCKEVRAWKKEERDMKMLKSKKDFIMHTDKYKLKNIPVEFIEFLKYSHNLGFDENPDYDFWLDKFVRLIDQNRWNNIPSNG